MCLSEPGHRAPVAMSASRGPCDDVSPQRTHALNLDTAAKRLSEISGSSIRDFATRDFGRDRNLHARSVVVPKAKARRILQQVRSEIGPELVAFIGTTQWSGNEKHVGGEAIVVANGTSQLEILRVARSNAVNYGMVTDDLIKKLTEYDWNYGIDVFHAETDTIEFRFSKLPSDVPGFCKDLYKFCHDIVDQGAGSIDELEKEIRRTLEVYL